MLHQVRRKVRETIAEGSYDAVLSVGVDNVTYLSGCILPFANHYLDRKAAFVQTKDGRAVMICPLDWAQAIRDQGWESSLVVYDENTDLVPKALVTVLTSVFSGLDITSGRIGLDTSRTSRRFMGDLSGALPAIDWTSCDHVFKDLRIIKTEAEVELLEAAAQQSDKGIIGALHHLEGTVEIPGYTISEFSERVRVHIIEFGGSGIGHLSTLQGTDMRQFYVPHRGAFDLGNLVRIDVSNHHLGYWSNAGRIAVIGEPTDEQAKAFDSNLALKAAAQEALQPGVRCNEVVQEVEGAADKARIRYWREVGIGHGVGVSDREAPYLTHGDETPLEPGMVLALDVYTYGPAGELIHSKDTYEIVEGGCRLVSWYKDWNRLYVVRGFRATH